MAVVLLRLGVLTPLVTHLLAIVAPNVAFVNSFTLGNFFILVDCNFFYINDKTVGLASGGLKKGDWFFTISTTPLRSFA